MRILRQNKLSLEEIEQPTSDAPEVSSTAEIESTSEANTDADVANAEAIESRYLVLESMLQDWAKAGKLTPLILRQAHESLPQLKIAHGIRTHEERYQLAMEGILAQFKLAYSEMTPELREEHEAEHAKIVDTLSGPPKEPRS